MTEAKSGENEHEGGRSWRPVLLGLATLVLGVAPALGLGLLPSGAASPALGSLQRVGCRVKSGDPALDTPLYAMQLGASGAPNAWWCQLPHATSIPSGLVELRRDVAPLPDNQAIYETIYSQRGLAFDASLSRKGLPYLIVAEEADSSVDPTPAPHHPQFSSGSTVQLRPGVKGYLYSRDGTTSVSFAFPTTGVPKYLFAVTYVTVSGRGVPASTVLAVAKKVRPL